MIFLEERYDLSKFYPKIISGFIFGLSIFILLAFLGDFQNIKKILFNISPISFFGTIILVLISYFIRFFKWHYYLSVLNLELKVKDSILIFFIGMSMSITPGKLGELLKSYLLKKNNQIPVFKSMPVVFSERLTDLFAMIVLIGTGILFFSYGQLIFILFILCSIMFLFLLHNQSFSYKVIDILCLLPFLNKHTDSLKEGYLNTYTLFKFKHLFFATLLSVFSWFLECLALFIFCTALNIDLSLLHNIFVFSFGTILGAISMFPGGIGITEGSISSLFIYFGVDKTNSIALTLLIRFVTLWFGVFIGLFLLIIFKNKFFKK